MSPADVLSIDTPRGKSEALLRASRELGRGQVVVLPTDTTVAVAADAFSAVGRSRLAALKHWDQPVALQILFSRSEALHALAAEVTPLMTMLTEALWPGPLSIMTPVNPSLAGGLADFAPVVSLRIPDHDVLRELLADTGPLAVSGMQGVERSSEAISLTLEATVPPGSRRSTVIELDEENEDGPLIRIRRRGAVTKKTLQDTVGRGARVEIAD